MEDQQHCYGLKGSDVAIACFLNAFLRECPKVGAKKTGEDHYQLQIPVNDHCHIAYQISKYSTLGLHEYKMPAYLVTKDRATPLSFSDVLFKVVSEPALVGNLTEQQKNAFVARVLESQRNTHNAITHQPNLEALFSTTLRFEQAEQGLLAGHSVHPAPKSREQFSQHDAKRYSPEFGGKFPLRWFAVAKWLTLSHYTGEDLGKEARESNGQNAPHHPVNALADADMALSEAARAIPDGFALFPAHPWQAEVLLKHPDIKNYQSRGLLLDLGEMGQYWYPTTSTRSVYSPGLPFQLKFSLSVKLTNSIRTLSLKEVMRGTRLNQIFQSAGFAQVDADLPDGFEVMQEPGFLALLDTHGNVIDESLVALRDNLLAKTPDEEAVVLATLCQQHPFGRDSLLAARVKQLAAHLATTPENAAIKWFDNYCHQVVGSLFSLQGNGGIVCLAHQQNIVMRLQDGMPVGMYYRDCQGTGYTDLAYTLFPDILIDDTQDLENHWEQEKVLRYFPYYLIINSTFSVIASLSLHCGVSEGALLERLRAYLKSLKGKLVDTHCLNYVLESPALCCKGNFYCYLQDLNENAIPDPKVIYFDLPNPLVCHATDNRPSSEKEAHYV
ncbi:IucA/IucC family protein [Grimontia hollisae]|uniref:IucA/IucC family protein n=1 Tax=Grimontia hollisae TaxID=673 RepID=UPI0023DB6A62|nr:IucA/IucC family protein [Grimontia hollisae]MDF2186218.1 IucA/IucC family protein [Grimontia hollisae]